MRPERRSVLCLLPTVPFAANTGGALRTLSVLRALDASFDLTVVARGRGDPAETGLSGLLQGSVHVIQRPTAIGTLLDDAVSSGATRIFGISFEASDMESLKSQARDQAMANASAKAQQLAKDGGVTLGRAISIEESDTGGVNPVQAVAPRAAAAPAAVTTPVQPGQLQVSTTVRVIYAIQ